MDNNLSSSKKRKICTDNEHLSITINSIIVMTDSAHNVVNYYDFKKKLENHQQDEGHIGLEKKVLEEKKGYFQQLYDSTKNLQYSALYDVAEGVALGAAASVGMYPLILASVGLAGMKHMMYYAYKERREDEEQGYQAESFNRYMGRWFNIRGWGEAVMNTAFGAAGELTGLNYALPILSKVVGFGETPKELMKTFYDRVSGNNKDEGKMYESRWAA